MQKTHCENAVKGGWREQRSRADLIGENEQGYKEQPNNKFTMYSHEGAKSSSNTQVFRSRLKSRVKKNCSKFRTPSFFIVVVFEQH